MLPTKTSSDEGIVVDVSSAVSLFVMLEVFAETGIDEVSCFVPLSTALAAARRRALKKRVAVEKRQHDKGGCGSVDTTEGSTACATLGGAGRHVKMTGQRRKKEWHAAGLVIIIWPRRRYSAC